jgi:hypothetical protein
LSVDAQYVDLMARVNGGFVPITFELSLRIRELAAQRTGTSPDQWWIRDSRATELHNRPRDQLKFAGGRPTLGEVVTVAGPGRTVTYVTARPGGDFDYTRILFAGEGAWMPPQIVETRHATAQ